MAVVENTDEKHILTAMWLLPLYLLLIFGRNVRKEIFIFNFFRINVFAIGSQNHTFASAFDMDIALFIYYTNVTST